MRRGVSQHLVVDIDDLISREELEDRLFTIADIRVDVAAIRAVLEEDDGEETEEA